MDSKHINRLKIVLVEKRKTGLWLSKMLGVSPTTSRWCSNSYQPDLKTLFKIADILGVDVKDIIKSKEDIQ